MKKFYMCIWPQDKITGKGEEREEVKTKAGSSFLRNIGQIDLEEPLLSLRWEFVVTDVQKVHYWKEYTSFLHHCKQALVMLLLCEGSGLTWKSQDGTMRPGGWVLYFDRVS